MELYDKDENDIKGGGGLGILAADTRRVAEELGIPLVVVTPFYTKESHQELMHFFQVEQHQQTYPERLYRQLGRVGVSTAIHDEVAIDIYERKLGSTRIVTVTEPNFGELYPGSNSGDHRLYQEMALGFAGYQAIKNEGLNPTFMQLNEAPTVFAAVAMLDDLASGGMDFDQALETVRNKMLYTNHTLVQAVEGEFEKSQFEHMIFPNITSPEVQSWLDGLFGETDRLRLSLLAIELADTKSGVSKLHARVAEYSDAHGEPVQFEAVTNGISDKWILEESKDLLAEMGVMDEFSLPTKDYAERLETLSIHDVRQVRQVGRQQMDQVLAARKDQYGDPIVIPEGATVFDFKRRFASYKRPDLMFNDPDRLAEILHRRNAHFIMTGKPHANDEGMKYELSRLLQLIHEHEVLRERVHYVQDYDEEVGRALSVGADCAINVPVVGEEACGTSFMKDIANFKVLISTPDGGVADIEPIACLEVSGDESNSLYERVDEAAGIIGDDEAYRQQLIHQLKGYAPVFSGARMMGEYMGLFARLVNHR
jgi:starch phosphorylase